MYKYTRQEAAELLGISTRSIDRYIKSWKLRSKKDGKIVFVKGIDVENLKSWWKQKQEIIKENIYKEPQGKSENSIQTKSLTVWLEEIYYDLREDNKEKEKIIRELSIRVWTAEEIAKKSISLIDFKKSQFLLEESKNHLNQTVVDLEEDKEKLNKELKYQKTNNFILIISIIILFAIAGTIFVMKI